MKNKLKQTIAAAAAAAMLAAMPAAYADGAGISANRLRPGTNWAYMTNAHPEAQTATLTNGETSLGKTADENGNISLYFTSDTSDMIKIEICPASTRENIGTIYAKPRTFSEYSIHGLTPGESYLITLTSTSNGKALCY